MDRKLKNRVTRRKLCLNAEDRHDDGAELSVPSEACYLQEAETHNVDSLKTDNIIIRDAKTCSKYKLRDILSKRSYRESDEGEQGDFSPDCSEYIPSPDRAVTTSPSVSSSLGGDSQYIDHLLNNAQLTRTPSTISNLSFMLDNSDFVASSTVIYKPEDIRTPRQAKRKLDGNVEQLPLVDISLKPGQLNSILNCEPIFEYKDHSASISASNLISSTDQEKTLTSNHDTESDAESTMNDNLNLNMTLSNVIDNDHGGINKLNIESSESQEITARKDVDLKRETTIKEYQIEISIEPENSTDDIESNKSRSEESFTHIAVDNNMNLDTVRCESVVIRNKKNDNPELSENNSEVNFQQRYYEELYNNVEFVPDSLQNDIGIKAKQLESQDPLCLSKESTVYDEVNEYNDGEPQRDEQRIGVQIEVIRLEADTDEVHIDNNLSNQTCESDTNNQQEPCTSKDITRKRKNNVKDWNDNKNKRLKNSGQGYKGNRNKKDYPAKTIKPTCNCKKNCGTKFTAEERQDIFTKFYKLGSRELQWQYIIRHTKTTNVKRMTIERKRNNRTQTIIYYFPKNSEEVTVCKIFFLHTLDITEQMIYTAIEKFKTDQSLTDLRGSHLNRPQKMSSSTEASIIKHIQMFPKIESHYTRKESKREYLSESLNISKMYRLYKLWFSGQDYSTTEIASQRQYTTLFNTKFNYSFFKPKKDQCPVCAKYEQADVLTKASLEEEHTSHLKRKEKVRQIKNEEKENANVENTTIAIYDLQKVLNIPQSEVSTFHYKRKYPVYNFTIFDALRKRGYCYVWHGIVGKKGCTEIGSCLLQFLRTERGKGISKIVFYSDGCYGQNKNRYIFALYLYAAKILQIDITHRFFVGGHSQNEGDSMHSCIERNMKNKVIYTPDQIYGIIMNSKVTGEKYVLKEIDQSEILDIKSLVVPTNWRYDKKGEKIRWSQVMEISVSYSKPDSVLFKYDFDEEYSELDNNPQAPQKRGRGRRPQPRPLVPDAELKPAYNNPFPISQALHTDLHNLCNSGAIPRYYHSFYETLTYEETVNISEDENVDSE